jgi:UDP-2,3-diacylglucosamine hydrolase
MHDFFISDLHLSADAPLLQQRFSEFLHTHQAQMGRLFILGDLVDAWVGDDDDSPFATELGRQIATLSQRGVAVAFLHGNRDFLIGPDFCQRSGMQLLPDYTDIESAGCVIRLSHGDALCTADLPYQQFRAQVRAPAWQQAFLAQPLSARREFANKARAQSKAHQADGDVADGHMAITDAAAAAVTLALQQAPSGLLLHGHTHRPALHQEPSGTRIVLGDWGVDVAAGPSWLKIAANGAASLHARGWRKDFDLHSSAAKMQA